MRAQGLYYLATGLWPLVHLPSFLAVTGDKSDRWLVRTVGALATVIGATLVAGARRPTRAVRLLALGAGAAFSTVDVVYVRRGVIPRVYLADVAAHAALLGWAAARAIGSRRPRHAR